MPEPLPACTTEFVSEHNPNVVSAYRTCLKHEEELTAEADIRQIRVLGYLLYYAPNPSVGAEVARSISVCNDNSESLVKLGQFFEQYVIRFFKKNKGRTPAVSSHPSQPPFEDHWKAVRANITEAPKNHQDAKDRALVRDNWTCPATGAIDYRAPADIRAKLDRPAFGLFTECAHIIPESTFFSVEGKENPRKCDYSANVLSILKLFHYDIEAFMGKKVHSLNNVITLAQHVHDLFDRLMLYFEATPTKNRYKVVHYDEFPPFGVHEFVIFSSTDPKNLAVPLPELLALHALCCKVAYMSGAAEHIDKVYEDAERMGVLANDGSSNDILHFKLLSLNSSVSDQYLRSLNFFGEFYFWTTLVIQC